MEAFKKLRGVSVLLALLNLGLLIGMLPVGLAFGIEGNQGPTFVAGGYIVEHPQGQFWLNEETCFSMRPPIPYPLDPGQNDLWRQFSSGVDRRTLVVVEGRFVEKDGAQYLHADRVSVMEWQAYCDRRSPAWLVRASVSPSEALVDAGATASYAISFENLAGEGVEAGVSVDGASLPPKSSYSLSSHSLALKPGEKATLSLSVATDPSTPMQSAYSIRIVASFKSEGGQAWESVLLATLRTTERVIPEFPMGPSLALLASTLAAAILARLVGGRRAGRARQGAGRLREGGPG